MAGTLDALVAELNATKTKLGDQKPEKKAPAKRSQPSAASKAKAKTGSDVTTVRSSTSSIAAALALASASAAVPDPSTAALAKRVKDVLDCLYDHNGSQLSPAEISELKGLNLHTDIQLLKEVHRHPRITYQGAPPTSQPSAPAPTVPAAWYAYRPEITGVHDRHGLLTYIRDNKGPAVLAHLLRHCYLRAAQDLQDLRKEGLIFIVGHPESQQETVFVRDMLNLEGIQEDVRDLWFEVCKPQVKDYVPRGLQELQAAVVKAGLRSALANQPVKRALPGAPKERAKKPRKQRFNVEKATNAHLPSLFAGVQPKALDS